MRAAILLEPYNLRLMDIPKPKPHRDEVLLEVKACGICGSDVRYFMGENPWALHTIGINEPMPPNTVLGHEVCGTVVEGEESTYIHKGDYVGVIAFRSCGECEVCRKGLHNLCAEQLHIGHDGRWKDREYIPGGFADFMPVWRDKVRKLSNSISPPEATQLDGLAVAVHAVRRAHISQADSVAIIGSSAIGLLLLQVAKAYGADFVFSSDILEKPLDVASSLGADMTINARRENLASVVERETGGRGVDVVFDTVGSRETFKTGLKILKRAGRMVLLAVTDTEVSINLRDLSGERIITSSANNLYPEYDIGIRLMATGKVRAKPFITHIFNLNDIVEAFDIALHKEDYGAIKVVITP